MSWNALYGKTAKTSIFCFSVLKTGSDWREENKAIYDMFLLAYLTKQCKYLYIIIRRDWGSRKSCFAHLLHLTPNSIVKTVFFVYRYIEVPKKAWFWHTQHHMTPWRTKSGKSWTLRAAAAERCWYPELCPCRLFSHNAAGLLWRSSKNFSSPPRPWYLSAQLVLGHWFCMHRFTHWPKISPVECCGTKQIMCSFIFKFYHFFI